MRVALYQPDIPQNTGNIFRLCACLDISLDIIGPTGYIFDEKKFRRSSMDYFQHTSFIRHTDWEDYLKFAKEKNFRLILLTTKSKNNYIDFVFKNDDVLLFGQESAGVPNEIHNDVDSKLTIPMKKNMRSINISSAVAIVLGEACRQLKLF